MQNALHTRNREAGRASSHILFRIGNSRTIRRQQLTMNRRDYRVDRNQQTRKHQTGQARGRSDGLKRLYTFNIALEFARRGNPKTRPYIRTVTDYLPYAAAANKKHCGA